MKNVCLSLVTIFFGLCHMLIAPSASAESGDGYWDENFGTSSINGPVNTIVRDSAGNVYIGGQFSEINGVLMNGVAKWDGSNWLTLDSGLSDSPSWCGLSCVKTLAIDSADNLYAGGLFNDAGGISVNNIAKWDGNGWSSIGAEIANTVQTIAIDSEDNLYAAGQFGGIGDYRDFESYMPGRIAKWDGVSWSTLGSEMDSWVYALAFDDSGYLYATGNFTTIAGGIAANYIARWDGENWTALGSGMNAATYGVAFDSNGVVYTSGYFTTAGGISAKGVAKWDGANWSALGVGIDDGVFALALDRNGNLYAGGQFTSRAGINASKIARWDGSSWTALGSNVQGSVYALMLDTNDNLYVGESSGAALWRSGTAKIEVSLISSCLAGNGRVDLNIVNSKTAMSTYRLELQGLTARQSVVMFEDWGRIPISGRLPGSYLAVVKRDGQIILSETLNINCSVPTPNVSAPEVTIMNACRASNGYILFQMVNAGDSAKPYVIEFEGVNNRSTTAAAFGQAVRATTGRPDGTYDYLVRSGSTIVDSGEITVDCD